MGATIRIQIKANAIPGVPPGHVFTVQADSHGTPLDEYWRRRLKDAVTDECCEVVRPFDVGGPPNIMPAVDPEIEYEDEATPKENEK